MPRNIEHVMIWVIALRTVHALLLHIDAFVRQLTHDIGSVAVVRDASELNAFANVSPHRVKEVDAER